jgi:hypothetical protein
VVTNIAMSSIPELSWEDPRLTDIYVFIASFIVNSGVSEFKYYYIRTRSNRSTGFILYVALIIPS